MTKIFNIIDVLETAYPLKYSEKWDKSGLQVGSLAKQTDKIILALDPLEEVVDHAIEVGAKLVITHHPMAISSIFPINTDTYLGRVIEKAVKHDITLYAAHTNFDSVEPTVSDSLLKELGFIYSEKDFLEKGREENIGLGRMIHLVNKMSSKDVLNAIKEKTFAKYLRFVGDIDKVIERVAVMGGSGASFIETAFNNGADLYITGDIKYHEARLAEQLGINLIDLGHFYSESHSLKLLKELLEANFKEMFIEIFNKENDPFIIWR